MKLTRKQLLDIISLSIEVVTSETDGTVGGNAYYSTGLDTPFIQELLCILDNEDDAQRFAIAANRHLAAIRLGMRIGKQC